MKHPEADLQKSVVAYLTHALPKDAWFTAVNPRPYKNAITAAMSKALGMKAGVPDLLIIYQGRAHFVELKAARGLVSFSQHACMEIICECGGFIAICRTIDEVCHALNRWAIPTRATVSA